MEETTSRKIAQPFTLHLSLVVRIGLALFATFGSIALVYALLEPNQKAHASGVNEYATRSNPWGIALDGNGHIFVAEPGCDVPVCATAFSAFISEYNATTGALIQDFTEPAGYSSPAFIAVDTSGNVWFTEPNSNAIGKLNPASGTWTQWPTTSGAAPFDLVFDKKGVLWFTEYSSGKIGSLDPTAVPPAVVEHAIPTLNSNPYGITMSPNGHIWFTENAVGQIATFSPTSIGPFTINEISAGAPQPHLITSDSQGNIWYSGGFAGTVVEYTTSNKVFDVSKGVCPTPTGTPSATPPACVGTHISGIAVDSNGLVWFDDSLSARVGFLNPADGSVTALTLSNTGAHPNDGLLIDNHNTWFTEDYGNKLAEVPAGTLVVPPTSSPSPTVTPPTTPPAPVNTTWYFAEGRVGKGFREFLTIDNPGTTACSVSIQYLYTMDGAATSSTKTVSVSVPAASRLTQPVNTDLGIDALSPAAATLASTVTVAGSTPSCPGVVVERPVYFNNYHGLSSGTDVLGATQLGTSYTFADVASGAGHTSYLTIMNPGNTAAVVTVNYYANGQKVQTQIATVAANSRGTIAPGAVSLPTHTAAVVTSSKPIMVERPTYFMNVNDVAGNASNVFGAADITGVQSTANDWLFAEGYTGPSTQENLTIANVDPSNKAMVTIKLKSNAGAVHTFSLSVNAQSQLVWEVNINNLFSDSTPEVSTEVQSTGANIVVQRQMYFQYHHTVNNRTVLANGVTDVLGEVGPASKSAYSFAEGYTNTNYNEWLTVQNPTANSETIDVTLVNSKGHSYKQSYTVVANSRLTVDITAVVVQHLVQPGDNYQGYEVAMTVQTLTKSGVFIAERPMYWNTIGTAFPTQGGTDIIGYAG